MTLLSEASFLVTPNGYKEDKLYAAIPTNGNGDMTFTRATTATRVNEAGLVELVPYNLLSRSEDFSNGAWVKESTVTVTPNVEIAPDGTLTADLINMPINRSMYQTYSIPAGEAATASVYIKGTAGETINFAVKSGNFTKVLTGEWQRIEQTSAGSGTVFSVNRYSGGTASSFYLWGYQVVEGSTAKDYQKTVDRLDIPRIDYTGGGCPSILLEPQRTNLLLRSEEFDNASWGPFLSSTITPNTSTAPDGTLTADRLQGQSSSWYFGQTKTLTNGAVYTISMYVKSNTGLSQTFRLFACNIILSSDFTATNEWQRFSFTFTSTFANVHGIVRNSSNSTNDLLVWGAQVEAGAYPTSYIPTTTATVTRNADAISKTGISDLIGQTEGVMFIESAALFNDLTNRQISLSDGTTNNRILIAYNTSLNIIQMSLVISNIFIFSISYSISDETQFAKIAVRYSNTLGYSLWVNGVNRNSNASTSIPSSIIRLGFDGGAGGSVFFAKVKSAQLYKTYLSDAQMAALTTL